MERKRNRAMERERNREMDRQRDVVRERDGIGYGRGVKKENHKQRERKRMIGRGYCRERE